MNTSRPQKLRTPRQAAWCYSARWREIARRHCLQMNAERASKPKCGARARTTGEQCRQVAMANGRCRFHGGATPKGRDWHRPQWPNGKRPDAIAKAMAKAKDLERAAKQRERKVAAMSPAVRREHDAWKRSHKPGTPGERARARIDRQHAVEVRERLAKPAAPPSAERVEIERHLAELRREAKLIEARIRAEEDGLGVFG